MTLNIGTNQNSRTISFAAIISAIAGILIYLYSAFNFLFKFYIKHLENFTFSETVRITINQISYSCTIIVMAFCIFAYLFGNKNRNKIICIAAFAVAALNFINFVFIFIYSFNIFSIFNVILGIASYIFFAFTFIKGQSDKSKRNAALALLLLSFAVNYIFTSTANFDRFQINLFLSGFIHLMPTVLPFMLYIPFVNYESEGKA